MANQTFDSIKDPDERLSYLDAWETRVRAEIVDPARKYEVRTHNAILQAIAEWRLRQQQQE